MDLIMATRFPNEVNPEVKTIATKLKASQKAVTHHETEGTSEGEAGTKASRANVDKVYGELNQDSTWVFELYGQVASHYKTIDDNVRFHEIRADDGEDVPCAHRERWTSARGILRRPMLHALAGFEDIDLLSPPSVGFQSWQVLYFLDFPSAYEPFTFVDPRMYRSIVRR